VDPWALGSWEGSWLDHAAKVEIDDGPGPRSLTPTVLALDRASPRSPGCWHDLHKLLWVRKHEGGGDSREVVIGSPIALAPMLEPDVWLV